MQPWESYELTIKEFHLDTFSHVNNAVYLALYEEARWEVITKRGYDLSFVHKIKQGPVILDVHLKFFKELRLRERISITTELIDYPGKIGHLKQTMVKADGVVASEAVFTFALFDTVQRKIIEPTEAWKKAVGLV